MGVSPHRDGGSLGLGQVERAEGVGLIFSQFPKSITKKPYLSSDIKTRLKNQCLHVKDKRNNVGLSMLLRWEQIKKGLKCD